MTSSRLAATCLAATALLAGSRFSGSLFAQAQPREISFDSAGSFLSLPADIHLGEVAGVATTSKGNLLVYNQGGGSNATVGASRTYISGGARLFEFDKSGKFVREIGGSVPNNRPYNFLFAQGVRVDPQDNIWVVDRASRMVVKFDPSGRVLLTLGRRPEAIGEVGSSAASGVYGRGSGPAGSGVPGDNFNQPTDVAWDAEGNIFVSDGYSNARVAKFTPNGRFIKSWGATGAGPGQFNSPHSIAVDARGNVYVADMGNQRIQVFDNDCTFKTEIKNVGAPRAICISPGAHQYLYSSNSNPTEDPFLNGEIYKMELDGTVLGRFGHAGKQFKEFGMVNEIDCRDPNTLYVAELMNWRVQKLTLHPEPASQATQERR
ncbi:MAG: peptidyl-alpha-hydroxyglycine alpha-amidating lyase family protein [Vicinamibacteraceae bacterium]